jgi:hypothetical protein
MTLGRLRSLVPDRAVAFPDSLRLARRQAGLLLAGQDITGTVAVDLISDLRHVRVEYVADQRLPSAAFWDTSTRQWVIQIAWASPWKHQRVAVAREFKHILDYHHADDLYQGTPIMSGRRQAELAADYFAAHLLVPGQSLRRAWKAGRTTTSELSDSFCVPKAVIRQRLRDLRLGTYASHTHYHLTPSTADPYRSVA